MRKNAATGIDGQTVAQYGENLVENLRILQTQAKTGSDHRQMQELLSRWVQDGVIGKWLKAGVWEKREVR